MIAGLALLLLATQGPPAPPAKLAASLTRLFGPGVRSDKTRVDTTTVLRVSRGDSLLGFAAVGNVIGKDQPITYLVAIGPDDRLKDIDILVYREPYGGEVAYEAWRRQFRGASHGLAARGQGDPQHFGGHDQRPRGHARRQAAARRSHRLACERSDPVSLTWRDVSAPLRTLARWVAIIQVVGYTTSLVFVWHTTHLVPSGVAARYRGVDPEAAPPGAALQFSKSFSEMLTITHTHLLSMAVIFTLTGVGIALCARLSDRWKRLLIAEPFGALLVSFSAMWLMRYVDGRFGWLLEASSALLALTFYLQSYLMGR